MSRNLDTTLAPALANPLITPAIFVSLTFQSGVFYVWNGIGNYVFNGNTYTGVGTLGKISAIQEGSDVEAQGLTVTLSGIGTSGFDVSDGSPPVGVTPPVTVPEGQYVAWVYPTTCFANPGYGFEGLEGTPTALMSAAGEANGPNSWGSLGAVFSGPFTTPATLEFAGFEPPALPVGAVVQQVYPVFTMSGYNSSGGLAAINTPAGELPLPGIDATGFTPVQAVGSTLGQTMDVVPGASMNFSIGATAGDVQIDATLSINFVALAVYYTAPSNSATVIGEFLSDIRMGAPAQIYIGLMQNGSLIGTPYLAFSGQVDQPTVDIGVDTTSISIALENRLVNLARPTARRYTSADQRLMYPDDIGLNWVETLNDTAMRWGQSGS